jgi:hypothetical protein
VATPPDATSPPGELLNSTAYNPLADDNNVIGSPLKKARASVSGIGNEFRKSNLSEDVAKNTGFGFGSSSEDTGFGGALLKPPVTNLDVKAQSPSTPVTGSNTAGAEAMVEEEL